MNQTSSFPILTNVTATASGGTSNYGMNNTTSSAPTLTNVTATASGGTINYGMRNSSSASPTAKDSAFSGTTNSIIILSTTAKIGTSMLDGPVSGGGFTCVGVFDSSYSALSTSCL